MYLNVVCLKCGKTIPFQSTVPYSVDKIADGWNIISDESNGQIVSIRGTEIASVCSQDVAQAAKATRAVKSTSTKKSGSKGRLSVSQGEEE